MREELTEEYEADKQAALTQLSQQKELEMMAAREGWQRKVEDLLEQVTHISFVSYTWYKKTLSKVCWFHFQQLSIIHSKFSFVQI